MRVYVFTFCALLALVIGFPAYAQENNPGDRLLEREIRRQQLDSLARGQSGQRVTLPDLPGVVREEPCFKIGRVEITGNTIFTRGQLSQVIGEFPGNCLGQRSINNLLQRITAVYADAGYITTRAYVPAQDISSGALLVEVLEGRVEAFIYQQTDPKGRQRAGKPRKLSAAMPLQAGDVFQLRDLEQGLEQMNRLPSSQANANLIPGGAPGTSRIVVNEAKSDTIRAAIGVDNRGDEITGRTQVNLSFEADDLLSLNDTYFFSYSGSRNTNALAFGLSVPYRKWLFSATGSYSESFSSISEAADLFSQTGNLNFNIERLLMRNATRKRYAFVGVRGYWNERFINVSELQPQYRTSLSFGFREERREETYVMALNTSLDFGAPFLGGDSDFPVLTSATPRAEFTRFETRLTYIRPLQNGSQVNIAFWGQYSDVPLFSSEQLSIGGWSSVRGYNDFAFSGDSGAFLRSEFSFEAWPLDLESFGSSLKAAGFPNPLRGSKGGARTYVFSDAGYVYSRATRQSETMFSTGLGISIRLGRLTLNSALAIPLTDASGQNAGDVQAFFSLSTKIF